jgi:phosphohistidine phosphatase
MDLFLMRHAEAESRDLYPEDRLRPLTESGRQQQQRVVHALAPLLQPLHHLLSSPFVRARQTADIVAAALPCTPAVEETPMLAEACTVGTVLNLLQGYRRDARLLCVGHEPHMSQLSAAFLDGEGRSAIAFQAGSVLGLSFSGHPAPRGGTLRFFLRPADVLLLLGIAV